MTEKNPKGDHCDHSHNHPHGVRIDSDEYRPLSEEIQTVMKDAIGGDLYANIHACVMRDGSIFAAKMSADPKAWMSARIRDAVGPLMLKHGIMAISSYRAGAGRQGWVIHDWTPMPDGIEGGA